MKLNVDAKVFETADSTVWRSNPFYREPPYRPVENVRFRRMCENSMTCIADACHQSALLMHAEDTEDVDACVVAAVREMYEIAGDRLDRDRPGDTFQVTVHTEDDALTLDGVTVVVAPVSTFGTARGQCGCGVYKHKVVLWRSDGIFFVNIVCDHPNLKYTAKSSNRASFFNYLQKNLENLVTELKLNQSALSDFDIIDLQTDFNNLFQDLDSILCVEKVYSIDKSSVANNLCLKMCEESTEHVNIVISHCDCGASAEDTGLFDHPYIRNRFSKINFDEDFEKRLKCCDLSVEKSRCSSETETHNNEPDPESSSWTLIEPESCETYEETQIFEQKDTLPVIKEESYDILAYAKKFYRGRTSSESSDVAEWRRDLWLSGLDNCDEPDVMMSGNTDQWFSSTDTEGRVYFFEENSNKSSWTLPESSSITNNENKAPEEEISSATSSPATEKSQNRSLKSKSMILGSRNEELSLVSLQWPQLLGGTMCVLKEGPLNKTKITENGKRIRKNWTSTYAVLTELLLLFFKDNKGFPSMMSGKGGPELSVDLNGAVVDAGDKVSSRKNVYMLSTVLGLQVLIQCDCPASAQQWLSAIQGVIHNLPLSSEGKVPRVKPESPVEDTKPVARVGRSKSMKLKNKSASIEDLSNVAERQTKIRERLKKFFHRRPTVDLLVKKGIWKDEPVFGCLLEHTCPHDPPRVPVFVQHCVRCVERSEENMKTDGLYRVSGNLSQVQKIRLQVDQNVYKLLEEEEDVHVLAGTLKLFFRELRQPLIPFKFFDKALRASTNPNYNEKIKDFRDIVKSLPPCNHDTLKFLLQHLLRVTQFQEFNRMHIPNIAIVFGPTLMWPEQESQNMAFDMMQQNLVIECLLSEFHNIFR